MSKNWKEKLRCALQAIADLESYMHDVDYEDFLKDKMRMQAVERNLEIIGEAVSHIPEIIQAQYPNTDWSDIYGMRNILAHGYDIIDSGTVWNTATYDLDGLKAILEDINTQHGHS